MPCDSGLCQQFRYWWSTSIINSVRKSTYGDTGFVLAPEATKILCSFPYDMGTMTVGCKKEDHLPPSFFHDKGERKGELKDSFYGLHIGEIVPIAPQRISFLHGAQSFFLLQDGKHECVPKAAD